MARGLRFNSLDDLLGPKGSERTRALVTDLNGALDEQAAAKKRKRSSKADDFDYQCRQYGLPAPARELVFAKIIGRRWRFDFAFGAPYMVAVEIEGLVVRRLPSGELTVGGRHASISGFKADAIKYATAAVLGWTVLRFEQSQVKDRTAIGFTQELLCAKGWKPPA